MAFQVSSPTLVFKVKRCPPELVAPAKPTPLEFKMLSDLDDQPATHCQMPGIFFYRHEPSSVARKDPVEVIRQALAKTLVFYYPLAGRLREGPQGKLMVDCTGEGVIFIEADADVTLDQFGKDLHPPLPCVNELLYNVPGSDGMINSPLMLIQVTRLKCGGFIFAHRFNHIMGDATGVCMFFKALAEIARGASNPSTLPVWRRELLCARDPPRVTRIHHEFKQLRPLNNKRTSTLHHHSFFFGPTEIAAIRRQLPDHLAQSTTVEILTAFLWRCRTISLEWENPNQKVYLMLVVNARYGRCSFNPPLPDGFYGNAFVSPTVVTTVRNLCNRPLAYALELIKKVKNDTTEEYVHSVIDLLVMNGRPPEMSLKGKSLEILDVSDLSKAPFKDVNFGWGKPVYGGVAEGDFMSIYYIPYTNSKGELGKLVLSYLPAEAMERFAKELDNLLKIKTNSKNLIFEL